MYLQTKKMIQNYLDLHVYPGCSYAFLKDGKIESDTLGYAQISPTRKKLRPDTLFDMASLTKMIGTNSLLLQLIETQELTLDIPLKSYLPYFTNSDVTIRHLLTHTSDINPYIKNRHELSSKQLIKAILSLFPGQNIGKEVAYTDTGTILLGLLLEDFYSKPLHQLFEEKVLIPLKMSNSTFHPVGTNIAATEIHPQRGLIIGEVHDPKAYVLGEHCGSAGLFSNLTDSITFVQMMLAGGLTQTGHPFLQEQTIASLYQDWTPTGQLKRSLGWDLLYTPKTERPLLYHTGYTGTFMIIDKEKQDAFIFLSNRVHPVDNRVNYLEKRDNIIEVYLNEKDNVTTNLL